VPVNLKGGAIFGYEPVTAVAAIDPPVDLAVIAIRGTQRAVDAGPVIARLAELAPRAIPAADPFDDGNSARQGGMVRRHGAGGRADVQTTSRKWPGGRPAGPLSGAPECALYW